MNIIWLAPYYTYLLWFKTIWHGPITKEIEKKDREDESGMTVDVIINCGAEPKHAMFYSEVSALAFCKKLGSFELEEDEEECIRNSGEGNDADQMIANRVYDIFSTALGIEEFSRKCLAVSIVLLAIVIGGMIYSVVVGYLGVWSDGQWMVMKIWIAVLLLVNLSIGAVVVLKVRSMMARVEIRKIRIKRSLRSSLPSIIRLNEAKALKSNWQHHSQPKKIVAL